MDSKSKEGHNKQLRTVAFEKLIIKMKEILPEAKKKHGWLTMELDALTVKGKLEEKETPS